MTITFFARRRIGRAASRRSTPSNLVKLGVAILLAPVIAQVGTVPAHAAFPATDVTQLVSATVTGGPARTAARDVSMSADGRYVAFATSADDITPIASGHSQIYLRDVVDGSTVMVSSAAGVSGDDDSRLPAISADGRFVAFLSQATNLGPATSGTLVQAFVWERETGAIRAVSLNNDPSPQLADNHIVKIAISGDGTVVSFGTAAKNLSPDSTLGTQQVFRRDLSTARTELVSLDERATPPVSSPADVGLQAISGDGNTVAFTTASQLTEIPMSAVGGQAYVRDVRSGDTELVSVRSDLTAAGNGGIDGMSLSHDGSTVAFDSDATDLVAGTATKYQRVFVMDRVRDVIRLGVVPFSEATQVDGFNPSLSPDGSFMTFSSTAPGVAPGPSAPGLYSVYVVKVSDGSARLATLNHSATAAVGTPGPLTSAVSNDGDYVAFLSGGPDISRQTPGTHYLNVFVRNMGSEGGVTRLAGADRFAVSAAVSRAQFGSAKPTDVYVAAGSTYADALSGAPAAGIAGSPVLLTPGERLTAEVASEIGRLGASRIHVLGGPASVKDSVLDDLRRISGATVDRIGGADRYEVSAAVSQHAFPRGTGVVYVASGEVFADALSGGAAAGREKGPVLLTAKSAVPAAVMTELKRLAPKKIVVLGGVNSVSDAVLGDLGSVAPATRIGGADRFEVSAAVSASVFPAATRTVFVASGAVFPDALSGSAAAIAGSTPMLLVRSDGIPDSVAAELRRLAPKRIIVLGGTATVADSVLTDLKGYLRP
jgi:putative cell wall-binding protein/Tol biopolymer transport system component